MFGRSQNKSLKKLSPEVEAWLADKIDRKDLEYFWQMHSALRGDIADGKFRVATNRELWVWLAIAWLLVLSIPVAALTFWWVML